MKIVAILQVRMGSRRLPGKALLPLAGKPMVQNIIERVQRAEQVTKVVLAFPEHDAAIFTPLAKTIPGVGFYGQPGDENDVVGRYWQAAKLFSADLIVRIPCDNPCVDPAIIDEAVTKYRASPQIYVSTMYHHVRDRVYLDGVGAEVFSYSRLQWLNHHTEGQPAYREHPHLLFQDQHLIDGWEQYQRYANVSETIRLDVNTQDEYQFIKSLYDHFGHNRFTTADVVAYLDSVKVTA